MSKRKLPQKGHPENRGNQIATGLRKRIERFNIGLAGRIGDRPSKGFGGSPRKPDRGG